MVDTQKVIAVVAESGGCGAQAKRNGGQPRG
jgi:hypothetical protein